MDISIEVQGYILNVRSAVIIHNRLNSINASKNTSSFERWKISCTYNK